MRAVLTMWAFTFREEAESVRSNIAIIAGIVVSLGAIVAPFAPFIRRYLKARRERLNAALAATIVNVMRPDTDGIRAAARQQHDEQNKKLDAIGEQLAGIAATHGEHLARHDVQIAVLQARDPNSRSRKDDHDHAS